MSEKYGKGAIVDTIDKRDFNFKEVGKTTPPFLWNKGFDIEEVLSDKLGIADFKIPVKDQNGSFSCGGQAWAYYDQVLEAILTGSFEERSAKYIYSQTFVAPDGGSTGRDNCNILINQGCAREALTASYENGKPPKELFMRLKSDITEAAKKDAVSSKAFIYSNVDPDMELFAKALRDNNGLIMLITGSDNGSWTSPFPKPPKDSKNLWNHWVYIGKAKIINGKPHFGFLNSWGDDVGEKGWQWINEDYFKAHFVGYGWTISLAEKFKFSKDLRIGMTDKDVKQLQIRLNQKPETQVAQSGAGSPGLETDYFGGLTFKAVQAFQVINGLPNTGFFGVLTRGKMNMQ